MRELVDWMVPSDYEISERVIAQIIKESSGSPFFAVELVTHVQSGRDFDREATAKLLLDRSCGLELNACPLPPEHF